MSKIEKIILGIVAFYVILLELSIVMPESFQNIILLCFPISFGIILIIGFVMAFKHEKKQMKELEESESKEILDVLNTQSYSSYDKNYTKKLVLLILTLIIIVFLGITAGYWVDYFHKYINSKQFNNIILIIAGVLFVLILLIQNFVKIYRETSYASILEAILKKKYNNYSINELNNEYYPNGNSYLKEGTFKKYNELYLIEIPNLCTIKNYKIYNVESNCTNYGDNYNLIPTRVTKLFANILEYSYPINKNIKGFTKDFKDIIELQNNKELIDNIDELSKTRILEFKIENNVLMISKIIKNKNINSKDCIKDIDDIEIFKEKIVDIINR